MAAPYRLRSSARARVRVVEPGRGARAFRRCRNTSRKTPTSTACPGKESALSTRECRWSTFSMGWALVPAARRAQDSCGPHPFQGRPQHRGEKVSALPRLTASNHGKGGEGRLFVVRNRGAQRTRRRQCGSVAVRALRLCVARGERCRAKGRSSPPVPLHSDLGEKQGRETLVPLWHH